MYYTFISGASGGLGKAFVELCAKRGNNLFLTGRKIENLEKLKEDILQKYSDIDIKIFPCILSDEKDRDKLYQYVIKENLIFDRLINVAGVDIQKAFEKYTEEKIISQVRVNVEATICLTKFVLDRRSNNLEIITISSMSGLYPMPYFAIYSATKCALTSFFSSLRLEMKGKGVKITSVLPGGIPTRPDIIADIKGQGLWGKLSSKPASFVAEKSLKAVSKNKRRLIPGFFNKCLAYGTAIIPISLKMKFIANRWKKLEKDAF